MTTQQSPKVLVLGSGGREHALLVALSKSPQRPELIVAEGNAGCAEVATCLDFSATDSHAILMFAKTQKVNLVVVGPEQPLVEGVVDALNAEGIAAFGPSQAAAQLEASKVYAKRIMEKANVPTAGYAYCETAEAARKALDGFTPPYVIKEDGLAGGKGVTVAETLEDAHAAIARAEQKNVPIVIEEFLQGEELSVLAICDGNRAIPLLSAQDFKRVGDGNTGPNTGGMGAYAPVPFVDKALMNVIQSTILDPMLKTMRDEGASFKGILYAGLMIHPNGDPYVVEFNVRFGDPETQVVLPLLQDRIDLLQLLMDSANGDVSKWVENPALQAPEQSAVTIVMAANGYPDDYAKGHRIRLPQAHRPDHTQIYHAGTMLNDAGELVSNGGRVLTVTATGETLDMARERAYAAVQTISFEGGFNRSDIAANVKHPTRT